MSRFTLFSTVKIRICIYRFFDQIFIVYRNPVVESLWFRKSLHIIKQRSFPTKGADNFSTKRCPDFESKGLKGLDTTRRQRVALRTIRCGRDTRNLRIKRSPGFIIFDLHRTP